ncbi:MAG: hypothetical protein FJX64_12315 [Alphaproteobacteria bacterium]|nr:hypothetical protein [Alphaproteobacteria bacterium]
MSIATLRSDPASACLRNVYRTGPAANSFNGQGAVVEGGGCSIDVKEAQTGVFDLKAVASGYASNDFFFPWLQRGVGWVKVRKSVPDGTLVITGGVNGCTLVVSEHQTDYYFYHDGDSKYLKPSMITGNEVARVTPNDYDPNGIGQKAFEAALAKAAGSGVKPVGDVSYGHFIVSVKKNGQFGMYVTGVMSLNGLTRLPGGDSACVATFG